MTRQNQATIGNAWKSTGEALAAAMISVSRTFTGAPRANPRQSSKRSNSS
jgi:hypothetical protein